MVINSLKAYSFFILLVSILCISCESKKEYDIEMTLSPDYLHKSIEKLTEVLVHDIFSPPVASRNYAYPCIASYEVIRHMDSTLVSLVGQLNGFNEIPSPKLNEEYCYPLAASVAFLSTAKNFVFSEDSILTYKDKILNDYSEMGIPSNVFERSVQYGESVATSIIEYAAEDNYSASRSYSKFTITDKPFEWKPTPPAYMESIEPHWKEIRPFTLQSADQFTPPVPTKVSLDKNSAFYAEIMEVYDAVKNAQEEEIEIAQFWDCNPYKMNITGHVMHATKKITPGGHWIGITKIACEKANLSYAKSAEAYALVAIALADGFISCWDEKYRSKLIRPETLINEHIDPNWNPLLQTPPFPEYTSGHSVISTAAAVILTEIFGKNFSFADDTEVQFGLPVRKFDSFLEASAEAAISRLYGGIHYRPAIDNGVEQGRALGEYVVQQLETRL